MSLKSLTDMSDSELRDEALRAENKSDRCFAQLLRLGNASGEAADRLREREARLWDRRDACFKELRRRDFTGPESVGR